MTHPKLMPLTKLPSMINQLCTTVTSPGMACTTMAAGSTHQPFEVVPSGGKDGSSVLSFVEDSGRTATTLDAVVGIDIEGVEESGDWSDRDSLSGHKLQPSEVEERLENNHILGNDQDTNDSVSTTNSYQVQSTRVDLNHRTGFWYGVWACLGPVVGLVRKDNHPQTRRDTWDIPFADIRELDFVGSGSQGAVFAGEYRGKRVAVKKVKEPGYCDEIRRLRKLTHPNIVKFL